MTQSGFTDFYPQFAGFTPEAVLAEYVRQANGRFGSFAGPDAEEARRLYTAHRLTMYARTVLPDGAPATPAQLAAAGEARKVTGRKAGEVSVTYAAGAASSAAFADLEETSFGLQLRGLLRLYGRSAYIP